MSASLPADFAFVPKVWADHADAYFDRKLVWGALAVPNKTLASAPGTTINFPFFKSIGDAEEPAADEALSVDKLQDDSFSATVKEVGKAVGVRNAALMTAAAQQESIFSQIQQQMGRVIAEKVDKDLIAEINGSGNYTQGFTSASNSEKMTINRLLQGKITAFGDKHEQAVACFMHSQHFLDLMTDSTAGFLKADANDPFWGVSGFMGRILGMALFTSDTCPASADIGGKKAYEAFIMKANPYGFMVKAEMDMGRDYDLLNREWIFAATQWYAVKAFHGKISADDKRIARLSVVTGVSA